MQIPETPEKVQELDLMKRLEAYANGKATWHENEGKIGPASQQACESLHADLVRLANVVFDPILTRTTARETEMFTMHDSTHARKVAHLMWHILEADRRERLTPPEIGIMVAAAYLHDIGMALSPEERKKRLAPESDLWEKLEIRDSQHLVIETLRTQSTNEESSQPERMRAQLKMQQIEEALLCLDTRESHATRARYEEIIQNLTSYHNKNPAEIPDINTSLAFEGESFLNKLIDVCVAHSGDAEVLVQTDGTGSMRPRYPRDYPVGSCKVDLHMVAAALRLADILDFDRERTPFVLFNFLLPGTLSVEDRSVVEWGKHMAISNWHIEDDAIIFRGRCKSHIIHHAVVQFCEIIQKEIEATRATFGALTTPDWPFILPASVKSDIHEEGYRYIPYRFELDDERVYELFMGGAIYESPLSAVRELVQNAVDACRLRDSMTRMHEPHIDLRKEDRITLCYKEPTESCPHPLLIVKDTGTGMDGLILERFFLRVGQSFYRSTEFNEIRFQLRKAEAGDLDFAPVSEFGIGFLSSFLLADHLKVETAMWEPLHGADLTKRTLWIDGPTRLIRLEAKENTGPGRFKGTEITLFLSRGGGRAKSAPPSWKEIVEYLRDVCQDLPYPLHLRHVTTEGQITEERIDPVPLKVELPSHLEPLAVRIPVRSHESGLEGEIVIVNPYEATKIEKEIAEGFPVAPAQHEKSIRAQSPLLRGGFKVGTVPGLPDSFIAPIIGAARLRFTWKAGASRKYPMPNIARDSIANTEVVKRHVVRIWLSYLLDHVDILPEGLLYFLSVRTNLTECEWLEQYNVLTIYRLAKQGWRFAISKEDDRDALLKAWERGKGEPLRLGIFRDAVHWQILDMILPKITTLQMGGPHARFYVKPPKSGWQKTFERWQNVITSPVSWGPFVEYVGDIKDLLAYDYPGVTQLNARFQERISTEFSQDEFAPLCTVLKKIADSRDHSRQAILTDQESELFRRSLDSCGDLEIGGLNGTWRIDTFTPTNAI